MISNAMQSLTCRFSRLARVGGSRVAVDTEPAWAINCSTCDLVGRSARSVRSIKSRSCERWLVHPGRPAAATSFAGPPRRQQVDCRGRDSWPARRGQPEAGRGVAVPNAGITLRDVHAAAC
jgi:hypothetical protein